MVWCNFCTRNVPGVRPIDGALACDLCGMILENFQVTFVKNAAGQVVHAAYSSRLRNQPAEKSPNRSKTETDMEKTKKEEKKELKSNEHENGENEEEVKEDDAEEGYRESYDMNTKFPQNL